MSLHITLISSKLSTYENCLDKMSINNRIKFYTARKYNEELLKLNFTNSKLKHIYTSI